MLQEKGEFLELYPRYSVGTGPAHRTDPWPHRGLGKFIHSNRKGSRDTGGRECIKRWEQVGVLF